MDGKNGKVKDLRIEILFWEGCPSYEKAYERLKEVLKELKITPQIERIEVDTDKKVKEFSFRGSPTIRINGKDIDPEGEEKMPESLTCRIYRFKNGRISPIPSKEMLKKALLTELKK